MNHQPLVVFVDHWVTNPLFLKPQNCWLGHQVLQLVLRLAGAVGGSWKGWACGESMAIFIFPNSHIRTSNSGFPSSPLPEEIIIQQLQQTFPSPNCWMVHWFNKVVLQSEVGIKHRTFDSDGDDIVGLRHKMKKVAFAYWRERCRDDMQDTWRSLMQADDQSIGKRFSMGEPAIMSWFRFAK